MSVQVIRVGEQQTPVVIIDNFVQEPERIIELAINMAPFPSQQGHYYPGRRQRIIPSDGESFEYVRSICGAVAPIMSGVYGILKYDILDAGFSLITTQPKDLQPLQTIPHFDHHDADGFAILHFLSKHPGGGTGFYRHERTGIENMTEDQLETYSLAREADLRALGPGFGYHSGDANGFLELAMVESRFNRALIYPGRLLHSGIPPQPFNYSPDPRLGRLTGNIFIGATVRK